MRGTPNDQASILKKAHDLKHEGVVDTLPPPLGAEFMDGDMFALICGDDICVCTTNVHVQSFRWFVAELLKKTGLDPFYQNFDIKPVASSKKLELLKSGVKSIELGATLQEASFDYQKRQQETAGVLGAVGAFLKKLKGSDIESASNLNVSIEISADGRLKKTLGSNIIEELAEDLVGSDNQDFRIETNDGTFTRNEIFISTKVNLEKAGSSVKREQAFGALIEFYSDLRARGVTEQ